MVACYSGMIIYFETLVVNTANTLISGSKKVVLFSPYWLWLYATAPS